MSECGDDEKDWFPQMSVCWPTAQLEAAKGLYAALHEDKPYHDGSFKRWAKERSHSTAFHFSDGVSFYLSEADDPDAEDFLRPATAP